MLFIVLTIILPYPVLTSVVLPETILIASIKLKSTSKGENLYTAPAAMQILFYTVCRLVFLEGRFRVGRFCSIFRISVDDSTR